MLKALKNFFVGVGICLDVGIDVSVGLSVVVGCVIDIVFVVVNSGSPFDRVSLVSLDYF